MTVELLERPPTTPRARQAWDQHELAAQAMHEAVQDLFPAIDTQIAYLAGEPGEHPIRDAARYLDAYGEALAAILLVEVTARRIPKAVKADFRDAVMAVQAQSGDVWQLRLPGLARVPITAAERRRIIERDGHTCAYCRGVGGPRRGPDSRPWHIDHVWPVRFGGDSDPSNYRLACATCNGRKGARINLEGRDRD